MKKCVYVFLFVSLGVTSHAQKQPVQSLTLDDLSAFRQQAGNWQIVGDVMMDPNVDVHPKQEKPVVEETKKKKSKQAPAPEPPKAVTFQPGKGILLNINDATKKDHIVTTWEHGDIDLELEVMLPKGSNSGIYLQGRYEVQLYDSWGVKNPKYSDIGGIYRNWEKEPGKIYMGKAPLSNPAKAPGLWQKFRISFRAPKFDQAGNKIANARFIYVELNGVKIHENVEVPLPTGGPIENNEKAKGPLMIQGDHGPVAIRNIKYNLLKDLDFKLSDLTYKTYKGTFRNFDEFADLKPVSTGTSQELTCEVLESENQYAYVYNGKITVPEDNQYQFEVQYTGALKLTINNQDLVSTLSGGAKRSDKGTIDLKAGTYSFELKNYKYAAWLPPRLGLFVSAANSYQKPLHAFNSFPPDDSPVSPIFINVASEPKLLRAFLDFNGDIKQRLTHTIGVGDPSGTHYIYDLNSGNIVCVWKGGFVNATPMWHDRGDGSFRPLGATQYLFTSPPLAFLTNDKEAFPASAVEKDFRSKGYIIEASRPVFKYIYKGLEVEDKTYPDDEGKIITHDINIKNRGTQQGLYYKLAEGSNIVQMPDGTYCVGDKQYYIKASPSLKPAIREINGKKELVVPVEGSSIKYSVIW